MNVIKARVLTSSLQNPELLGTSFKVAEPQRTSIIQGEGKTGENSEKCYKGIRAEAIDY